MKQLMTTFILLPSLLLAQEGKDHIREGNRSYNKGEVEKAGEYYEKALSVDPKDEKAIFNLGDALYRQEKYAEAAEQFEMATAAIENVEERAKAWHNYGNSMLQAGDFQKSVNAFKNALKADPSDDDTRYNLAYAQQKLLQEQQQQKQDQENDDKEDKEDKDEEKEKSDQDKENDEQKDDNEDGEPDPKDQDQEDDKNKQPQPSEQNISKEDAERLLNALNNEEKDVQNKVRKKKMKVGVVKVEKDW